VDEESVTPCPICGDRYPAAHLLANCAEADPVCPVCIFDGDQPYRTDLPYLPIGIDHLLHNDLAAPAGWSDVATLLGFTCGINLGNRLQRELGERRALPIVLERWHDPMRRSWIWLPQPADRHEAFRRHRRRASPTGLSPSKWGAARAEPRTSSARTICCPTTPNTPARGASRSLQYYSAVVMV
jgi:hypothetical protein